MVQMLLGWNRISRPRLLLLLYHLGWTNCADLERSLDKFAMDRRYHNSAAVQGSGCWPVAEPNDQGTRKLS